jgi:hypothetical protein
VSKFYRLGHEKKLVARLYELSEINPFLEKHGIVLEQTYGVGLLCLLLRPEFEKGIFTAIPRWFSKLEEKIFPFYRSNFLANRCQIFIGVGRKV